MGGRRKGETRWIAYDFINKVCSKQGQYGKIAYNRLVKAGDISRPSDFVERMTVPGRGTRSTPTMAKEGLWELLRLLGDKLDANSPTLDLFLKAYPVPGPPQRLTIKHGKKAPKDKAELITPDVFKFKIHKIILKDMKDWDAKFPFPTYESAQRKLLERFKFHEARPKMQRIRPEGMNDFRYDEETGRLLQWVIFYVSYYFFYDKDHRFMTEFMWRLGKCFEWPKPTFSLPMMKSIDAKKEGPLISSLVRSMKRRELKKPFRDFHDCRWEIPLMLKKHRNVVLRPDIYPPERWGALGFETACHYFDVQYYDHEDIGRPHHPRKDEFITMFGRDVLRWLGVSAGFDCGPLFVDERQWKVIHSSRQNHDYPVPEVTPAAPADKVKGPVDYGVCPGRGNMDSDSDS